MNLIMGVDPGTTKAYALISSDGRIVKTSSSKTLTASRIVSEAAGAGSVIVVATDRKKTPGFVEKVAVKLGARIIRPEEDLKSREKIKYRKKYRVSNHSGDALAAAFYAYKKLRPLIKKIGFFAEDNEGSDVIEKLESRVIKEKVSIKKTFEKIRI